MCALDATGSSAFSLVFLAFVLYLMGIVAGIFSLFFFLRRFRSRKIAVFTWATVGVDSANTERHIFPRAFDSRLLAE